MRRAHYRFLLLEVIVFILLFIAFDLVVNAGSLFWSWSADCWGDFLVSLAGGVKY
jgi:hypothetical protein